MGRKKEDKKERKKMATSSFKTNLEQVINACTGGGRKFPVVYIAPESVQQRFAEVCLEKIKKVNVMKSSHGQFFSVFGGFSLVIWRKSCKT